MSAVSVEGLVVQYGDFIAHPSLIDIDNVLSLLARLDYRIVDAG